MYHFQQLQSTPSPQPLAAYAATTANEDWRLCATPNVLLLREADFSGALADWRSKATSLPSQRQPAALQNLDLDRILAYAG